MILKNNTIFIKKEEIMPKATIKVASDKSISHRAVICGALANGTTVVKNILLAEDTLNTIAAFKALGTDIEINDDNEVIINGCGGDFSQSEAPLYMGNSGTTTRLMMGVLSHLPFETTLTGDESLNKRPMNRVALPLKKMGADIIANGEEGTLPITVSGGKLEGIDHISPIASAQVKSAILLAGLFADGKSSVTEPSLSRDHTERMLTQFGAKINRVGLRVSVRGGQKLTGQEVVVPADISSAAYFMALGLLCDNAEIIIENVGINPTRTGIIDVIKMMGGDIELLNETNNIEPAADIKITQSHLDGVTIGGSIIPRLIDEIPIIAVMAAFADGQTIIKDAAELKVKESNRIDSTVNMIKSFGGDITPTDDGFIINGNPNMAGNNFKINANGDHRIAMSSAILALSGKVECEIKGADSILTSFPDFIYIFETFS